MGDGCARDWGAGTSIGGKKMSLHEKGDQTRALNHNSDFSARFRVDFPNSQTFANFTSEICRRGLLAFRESRAVSSAFQNRYLRSALFVGRRVRCFYRKGIWNCPVEGWLRFCYQNKQIIILYFTECSLLQVARQELLQKERSPPWVPESTVRIQRLQVRR